MLNLINPEKRYSCNLRFKPFTQSDLDFMQENKNLYTIKEMAKILGFAEITANKYASHFGIVSTIKKGRKPYPLDKQKAGKAIEVFVNTHSAAKAAEASGLSYVTVTRIISDYWVFKKKSPKTKIVTKVSKV